MSRIVPSNPANTSTPAFSTVSSPGGFQSGDLVYFRDSSFGTIPGNAVTSANFPITATVNQNQMAFNTTVNWAEYDTSSRTGSTTSRAPSIALLTNGNIVVAFAENNAANASSACFRIIDQNGAVVVGRTPLGFNSRGVMGVCALAGGGFAIASGNTGTDTIWHGVYSNTGAVVTAMAPDNALTSSVPVLEIRALSGGGYVIATYSSGNYTFRVYSSTGVPGNLTSQSGWGSASQTVITTFSDNTFAAIYPSDSTTLRISRFNNAGSFVASYTATTDWYNSSGYDFITLSTGLAVVVNIDSDGGSYWMWARTYDQSTGAVSGRTRIAGNQGFQQSVSAFALSGGGFVATNSIPATGGLQLRQYNASFGNLNTVSLDAFAGYSPSQTSGYGQRLTIVEGATFLTMVHNTYVTTSWAYHVMPYIQISKTDLTITGIRRRFGASQSVGSVSAPVSGYARSASTPNSASFLAANSQTLTSNIPRSSGTTFALAPFAAVADSTISSHCLTDMANGQFVISYRATNGSVRFSVFNADASTFTTVTVAAAGTANNLTRCTCIGNGKLVVSWVPGSNDRVNFSVYAANTYVLLATGTTAGSFTVSGDPSSWNSAAGHDIAPFGNDFFVLGYANQDGGVNAAVFNDSAVVQTSTPSNNFGGINNIRILSDASGTVGIRHYSTSQGQGYIQWFTKGPDLTSLAFYATQTLSNYTGNNFGEGAALSPFGTIFSFIGNGSTRWYNRSAAVGGQYSVGSGSYSCNAAGVCVGQYGDFVAIRIEGGGALWFRTPVNQSLGPYGTSVGQSLTDSANITISNPNTNSNIGSQAQIVNLYDNIYAFSYLNGGSSGSGQVMVGFICTDAAVYSANITAGVTPSSTALVPSPANGYYLAGVSASECTAGGTGVLQINGTATLNSQYPAGTTSQSFDFNTPALDVGVRGTIAGRNVILSGGK